MNRYLNGLEPVRVIGWTTSTLVAVSTIVKQIADNYDESTGWLGLGLAAVVVFSTEAQRHKVTPVKVLELTGQAVPDVAAPRFDNTP